MSIKACQPFVKGASLPMGLYAKVSCLLIGVILRPFRVIGAMIR